MTRDARWVSHRPIWMRWRPLSAARELPSTTACVCCQPTGVTRCMRSMRSAASLTTLPMRTGAAGQSRALAAWREQYRRSVPWPRRRSGHPRAVVAVARFHLRAEDFIAVIDGMQMDAETVIVAPTMARSRSLLRPGRLGGRTAFGAGIRRRLAGGRSGRSRPWTGVATDQHPARYQEDANVAGFTCRLNICRKRAFRRIRWRHWPPPALPQVCAAVGGLAHGYFRTAGQAMNAATERR